MRSCTTYIIAFGGILGLCSPACQSPLDPPSVSSIEQDVVTCTKYVATDGSDASPNDGSSAHPWKHIQYALNTATAPGTTICLKPGTYDEQFGINYSGSESGGYITLTKDPSVSGEVTIDGTSGSYSAVITVNAESYIDISNLNIVNRGSTGCSTCYVVGIWLGDFGGTYATPHHHVRIHDNTISEIEPTSETQISLPLFLFSWNTSASIHDISIANNEFLESDTNWTVEGGGITTGLIHIAGNVTDFEIRDNHFRDSDSNGIDTGGNQVGLNLHPKRGVFRGNFFDGVGSADAIPQTENIDYAAAIYLQATERMLVEQNYFEGCGYGVDVATEGASGVTSPHEANETWIRDNVFLDTVAVDFEVAIPSGYLPVHSTAFTNNTIYRMSSGSSTYSIYVSGAGSAYLGSSGSAITNNIVFTNGRALWVIEDPSDDPLLVDTNYWGATATNPYHWGSSSSSTDGSYSAYRTATGHDAESDSVSPSSSIFVGPVTAIQGFHLASSASSALRDGGEAVSLSWASTFGPYTPTEELDACGGPRVYNEVIGRGADEFIECSVDADCETFSAYCDPNLCTCFALGIGETSPCPERTSGECIVDPCLNQSAVCEIENCTLVPSM
jgi:hypothetical protein